ncbi:GYD domain-containing protein [Draconibacterium halophilum]|uniref:GYD domain-containing protein n=1 Tax=Draconibacterium halophilum TaxID=2706887 RepID=A0A6C0R9T2_9BACT|nr:GYD domain-containing protein [Draconibacterium halophilum]QIA06465.1 GYD domain-containing protein [Draconibacterium halophilum]
MAKYLVCGKYIGDGVKGLLNEGGTSRRSEIEKLVASLGGKVECVYYAFGEYDIYGIMDMPDSTVMVAFSLRAAASGLVTVKSVALLTPEEIDEAAKRTGEYRAPGVNWLP